MTDTPQTRAAIEAEDAALDSLLDEVAEMEIDAPDAAFLSRLIAEAEAARPDLSPAPEPGPAGWRGLLAIIGGWPALGGIAMAGLAGVWIGVAPPQLVDDAIAGLTGGTVAMELTGISDAFGVEG